MTDPWVQDQINADPAPPAPTQPRWTKCLACNGDGEAERPTGGPMACPKCGGRGEVEVPIQPHDAAAADAFCNGVSDDAPQDMQTDCGCGSCRLIWNTWNLKRAYRASREDAKSERRWADHERQRAEAAERDNDALREVAEKRRTALALAISIIRCGERILPSDQERFDAALAQSAKP